MNMHVSGVSPNIRLKAMNRKLSLCNICIPLSLTHTHPPPSMQDMHHHTFYVRQRYLYISALLRIIISTISFYCLGFDDGCT